MTVLAAQAALPPGGTGGGTIYYYYVVPLNTMNSDGSNKTPLPAGVSGEPSYSLHAPGSARWFLYVANGELHAVRGDAGANVQLTDSFDGVTVVSDVVPRWAKDNLATTTINESDSFVSFLGDAGGLEAIYRANVAFDDSNVPFLSGAAMEVVADLDILEFEWSPSGAQLVYSRSPVLGLLDEPALKRIGFDSVQAREFAFVNQALQALLEHVDTAGVSAFRVQTAPAAKTMRIRQVLRDLRARLRRWWSPSVAALPEYARRNHQEWFSRGAERAKRGMRAFGLNWDAECFADSEQQGDVSDAPADSAPHPGNAPRSGRNGEQL